ncbi:MAG TPA: D-alanyl-D-alanine carboxypeptidase [Caulobacteraceae bacterium]|nr:D-alanyl-D-alanine carboxypeptidase [Caulobacteraceae bacterium]
MSPGVASAAGFFSFTEAPKYAAIVEDASSGEVLYERNADGLRYPASISKLMTLYLTFEALSSGRLHPDDIIVVSPHAAGMAPSKLGLRAGQTISVNEAMQAIAVHSANDMAVAMAEKIAGSEARFATMMTLKAHELGMSNTHYDNASGLPDARQISTARDIAILCRAILRDYPQYYRLFSEKSFTYNGHYMENHNHMLGRTPGVDGFKTGYIGASGFNLAASAVRGNRRLIVVVLGGSSTAARDAHVADLFDAGFQVLGRRALGQTTTIAQNLHEPAPIGDVVRPPTEEGSGDQGGVHIVLAAPQPVQHMITPERPEHPYAALADRGRPPVREMSRREERREEAREAREERGRHGRHQRARADESFSVQVGAYHRRGQARDALATLSHRYSAKLSDADRAVDPAHRGYYRARFSGLSQVEARKACRAMHAHHQTCEIVAPEG